MGFNKSDTRIKEVHALKEAVELAVMGINGISSHPGRIEAKLVHE